jgi:putative methyltransferase (TIGR04325 family)
LGYENDDLVDVVFQKSGIFREQFSRQDALMLTEAFTQSLVGLLFALSTQKTKEINVLDYGGACGVHYFAMRTVLGKEMRLNWHVVETPAMVRKARILETEELHFFSDITTARNAFETGVDCFHSSGAIQYAPDPGGILREILATQARYIMLNRLALSSGKQEIITVQESLLSANGPGPLPVGFQDRACRYPVTYYPKDKLEAFLREKYSFFLKFDESPAGVVEDQVIINVGYILGEYK